MKYQVFSHSKYRDGVKPGDDAVLCIPGVLAAILDGATDPQGGQRNGKFPGQFAAHTIARACAKLFLSPANLTLSAEAIMGHLSDDLRDNLRLQDFIGAPSTTLALVLFLPNAARLLTIGDSGIRINGDKVFVFHKVIDDVSTASRGAIFSLLRERITDLDQLEYACRNVVFLGLENAVKKGVLSLAEMLGIIAEVQQEFTDLAINDTIANFLEQGIVSQNKYANLPNHPLGYSALNGDKPSMEDVIDTTIPYSDLRSIELFSDGYCNLPTGQTIADWEDAYASSETEDFHSTGAFKTVKGATSSEFFDDRSVISIQI